MYFYIMGNVIIKKNLIESLINQVISELPFDQIKKNDINSYIDTVEIFVFFNTIEDSGKFNIQLTQPSVYTAENYAKFTSDLVKIRIITAMLQAAVQLKLMADSLSYDDKVNILIDLKNSGQLDAMNIIIADALEKDLTST